MIRTALTERFGLDLPVISAPMAFAAGGELAAAVSAAGGLGLIGGGYGDPDWIGAAFDAAGGARVGCGLITWRIAEAPAALEVALARRPAAMLLSFGDPAPWVARLEAAGVPMICQVQTLRDGAHAADLGAAAIVAQGGEAGGHGERRGAMALAPELRDWLDAHGHDTALAVAGGISDGRGLAAALALGADGVMVGTRLWASAEARVSPAMRAAALAATGDDTIRSTVMDVARGLNWPERYGARVLRNAFTERWHGREAALRQAEAGVAADWSAAWAAGDPVGSNTFVGEGIGLVRDIRPAGEIVAAIAAGAEAVLAGGWRRRRDGGA